MAYLGNDLQVAFPVYRNIDDISGSFNSVLKTFPLTVSGVAPVPAPLYSQQCLISVAGVVQRPDDSGLEGFRLSGGNIIFASAPTTGADFFGVILAGADYVNAGGNFPSGTAAVPSITFNDDLDTGIYNSGTNQVSITTGGSERLRIDSAGQVESVSLGTAAAPAFSFTTDPNTGIYSPGADQVAISTAGSGRLFVDSSGRIGVGVSSPGDIAAGYATLQIGGTNGGGVRVGTSSAVAGYMAGSASGVEIGTTGTTALNFFTNNQTRATITSAGLVGVGTSSPSFLIHGLKSSAGTVARFEANGTDSNISVKTSGREGIIGADTSQSYLLNTDAFPWTFWTNNTQRMTITSAGLVGIGTSTPIERLDLGGGVSDTVKIRLSMGGNVATIGSVGSGVANGLGNLTFFTRDGSSEVAAMTIDGSQRVGIGTTSPRFLVSLGSISATSSSTPDTIDLGGTFSSTAGANPKLRLYWDGSQSYGFGVSSGQLDYMVAGAAAHVWHVNNTERARIDSSGRLLVGTSTALTGSAGPYGSQYSKFVAVGNSSGSAVGISSLAYNGAGTGLGANTSIAVLSFTDNAAAQFAHIVCETDGTTAADDYPGRLVFSTTADGASSPTERMRITNGGAMLQGNTSDLTGVLGTGLKVKSNAVGSGFSAAALCLQGTGGDFYAVKFADQDMGILSVTSGGADAIQIGGSVTTASLYSNGLVQLPNVGTTASAANVFMDSASGNQLARSTSSLRYKTDIEDLDTDRADAALSLRPVWYRSKATADRKDWSHYGLIAEEVAEIEPRLVNWTYLEDEYITVTNEYGIESKELKPNAKLVPDGVQYERLSVLLLSVIQRQEKRIEYLEAEIATLKAQLS